MPDGGPLPAAISPAAGHRPAGRIGLAAIGLAAGGPLGAGFGAEGFDSGCDGREEVAGVDGAGGGDATCTETYASLRRTGEALLGELDRHITATFGITQAAATALAVIDGACTPLTPSQVSDRVLIASAEPPHHA